MKRSALVLGVLVLLLSLSAAAQTPSVDELLEKSLAAQQKGDYNGALQLLNQAVQAYPDSLPVRMRRLGFLEQIQGRGGSEDANRWLHEALVEDLRALARLAPDGREGGIARDALAKIEGREFFPAPKVSCPDGARTTRVGAWAVRSAKPMLLTGTACSIYSLVAVRRCGVKFTRCATIRPFACCRRTAISMAAGTFWPGRTSGSGKSLSSIRATISL